MFGEFDGYRYVKIEDMEKESIFLPKRDDLETAFLARIFDNTSESYKFFWFQAVLEKVLEGRKTMSYEELVDSMIVNAWYMVSEYHLNLGPFDTLEKTVIYLKNLSCLRSCEKKESLHAFLYTCNDKTLKEYKNTLIRHVPYRLQAPLLGKIKGKDWSSSYGSLINKINETEGLIYYFGDYRGLNTNIRVDDPWYEYVWDNKDILRGWLQYKMIVYLQKRNPSVPGISDKLYPPVERKLNDVKRYWKLILEIEPMHEIYGNQVLLSDNMSIDHFVPWSYVAHDELWNLTPTTKEINSSKSNRLPDWESYFGPLSYAEYRSYVHIWKDEKVRQEFDRVSKEHLNNPDVKAKLYLEKGLDYPTFKKRLEDTVRPVYLSAMNSGFEIWSYNHG